MLPSEDRALLGAEKAALRERVRNFATAEVEPHAARIDREARFPHDVYRRVAEEGLVGFTRAEGAGGDTLGWALVITYTPDRRGYEIWKPIAASMV